MPYSIGNSQLPVLQDNTSSTIGAMGDAFKAINNSFDKIANLPWLARGLVQENADARYSAALNKYSNDPDGLAKALANGDIDTSDVTANTLNQTQDRLKDIGNNYSRSYIQRRTETANNYLDKNGNQYLEAVNEAQAGHPEKLAQIRMNLGDMPWEVKEMYAGLNGQAEKDTQRSLANQGGALALQRQALLDMQNANSAFWYLMQKLQKGVDYTQSDPSRIQYQIMKVFDANPQLVTPLLKTKEGMEFLNKTMGNALYRPNAVGVYKEQNTITPQATSTQQATSASSEKSNNFGLNANKHFNW